MALLYRELHVPHMNPFTWKKLDRKYLNAGSCGCPWFPAQQQTPARNLSCVKQQSLAAFSCGEEGSGPAGWEWRDSSSCSALAPKPVSSTSWSFTQVSLQAGGRWVSFHKTINLFLAGLLRKHAHRRYSLLTSFFGRGDSAPETSAPSHSERRKGLLLRCYSLFTKLSYWEGSFCIGSQL